ncbi:hypothetical protein C8R43DRAFT_945704 [Mycena crocata]|nr:hypothetical protein C8R43DRAFT_945704 [Mycena crocata]
MSGTLNSNMRARVATPGGWVKGAEQRVQRNEMGFRQQRRWVWRQGLHMGNGWPEGKEWYEEGRTTCSTKLAAQHRRIQDQSWMQDGPMDVWTSGDIDAGSMVSDTNGEIDSREKSDSDEGELPLAGEVVERKERLIGFVLVVHRPHRVKFFGLSSTEKEYEDSDPSRTGFFRSIVLCISHLRCALVEPSTTEPLFDLFFCSNVSPQTEQPLRRFQQVPIARVLSRCEMTERTTWTSQKKQMFPESTARTRSDGLLLRIERAPPQLYRRRPSTTEPYLHWAVAGVLQDRMTYPDVSRRPEHQVLKLNPGFKTENSGLPLMTKMRIPDKQNFTDKRDGGGTAIIVLRGGQMHPRTRRLGIRQVGQAAIERTATRVSGASVQAAHRPCLGSSALAKRGGEVVVPMTRSFVSSDSLRWPRGMSREVDRPSGMQDSDVARDARPR